MGLLIPAHCQISQALLLVPNRRRNEERPPLGGKIPMILRRNPPDPSPWPIGWVLFGALSAAVVIGLGMWLA